MDIELRYARPDEFAAVAELDGASFGFHYSDEERADARLDIDPDRVLVAAREGRLVAVSAELPLRMTLPGGADLPVLGLTWVSVELTERRRGVLRELLQHQLRAAADAGAAGCVLEASEGGIYGRYGFGVATQKRRTVVDRRRARLAHPVAAGTVRRLTNDAARDVLPGLYDRWQRSTAGAVSRDTRRWQFLLLDREYQRRGMSGLFHLVHPDGYVSYRIRSNWGDGDPQHECWLVDYAPVTAAAHAALWQALLGIDLVGRIESYVVPVDDPLPLLLTDYRRVETAHAGDGMWLRPLDVPALLGGRAYAVEIDCVIGVADALLGDGRYRLSGGPDGATCVRTDALPDVQLPVAALGAACLGGTRLSWLARGGQVEGDVEAARRLDRALLGDRAPVMGTHI